MRCHQPWNNLVYTCEHLKRAGLRHLVEEGTKPQRDEQVRRSDKVAVTPIADYLQGQARFEHDREDHVLRWQAQVACHFEKLVICLDTIRLRASAVHIAMRLGCPTKFA